MCYCFVVGAWPATISNHLSSSITRVNQFIAILHFSQWHSNHVWRQLMVYNWTVFMYDYDKRWFSVVFCRLLFCPSVLILWQSLCPTWQLAGCWAILARVEHLIPSEFRIPIYLLIYVHSALSIYLSCNLSVVQESPDFLVKSLASGTGFTFRDISKPTFFNKGQVTFWNLKLLA